MRISGSRSSLNVVNSFLLVCENEFGTIIKMAANKNKKLRKFIMINVFENGF
jgi:hypothetical protein